MAADLSDLKSSTDSATVAKLEKALSRLELRQWLKRWSLLEYQLVIEAAGYTSRAELCGLTVRKAERVMKDCDTVKCALNDYLWAKKVVFK